MISDQDEAKLSQYMRLLEFLRKNEDVFRDNKEFMKGYEKIKKEVPRIISQLTDEERDKLLDRFKKDMETKIKKGTILGEDWK